MTRTEQEPSPSAHILIKEVDPDDPQEFIYRIECRTEGGCGGWRECNEQHEVDGRIADATLHYCGPFDCEPDAPWNGEPDFEFHGVMHSWRDDHGWTVPFKGCVVAVSDWDPPDEMEGLPPGRYWVEDDWDDDFVYLVYRGPEVTE